MTISGGQRHRRARGIIAASLGWMTIGSSAQAAPDPLAVRELERPDGTVAAPPRPPVWGEAAPPIEQRRAEARLAALRRELGPVWVSWDPHRDAPRGIITAGVPAPGSVRSAVAAEAYARAWLTRHLELLAPGASLDDFVLVSNDLSAGIRSVGFSQRHHGVPVEGGQLSLRFKADSLAYVASQALPRVAVPAATGPVLSAADARRLARDAIAREYPTATLELAPAVERRVLPLFEAGRYTYHDVLRVEARLTSPLAQYWVYIDAHTGALVAREQRMIAAATVAYHVPQRHPGAARYDAVAARAYVVESGNNATTDALGQVTLSASPTTIVTTVGGPLVDVDNSAASDATGNLPVADGQTVVWSEPDDEHVDAQLTAFVHAGLVKEYVRDLDPGLAWLDQTLDVTVNIGDSCNAASNGDAVFFLQSSGACQNTARLADVVYHEVGHSVHHQSIIPGVGAFESSLSEGVSDYLAATIVNDSGMGRGFFYTDEPLRELDPVGSEWTWPDDIGESHATGRIIGGTLWDLRTELMATLGDEAGREHADRIYYEGHRRAVDIPSMYPEALLYDDDDGNLANGTPNGCLVNAVFEAHGLLDPGQLGDLEVVATAVPEGRRIALTAAFPVMAGCPVDLTVATLRWRLRDAPDDVTEVEMVLQDGAWQATIPAQDAGVVVEYQVVSTFTNGTQSTRPQNAADPWYQAFFGAVVPIYCLDGDADPGEWSFGGAGNTWSFGPLGAGSGSDPTEPWDDDGVLLSMDGEYQPGSNTAATGPVVDIAGRQDVRLHYHRWLTVEDGFFDQAWITANGQPVWQNLATEITSVHHQDREWRFHDVELSGFIDEGTVQLSFGLVSDGGLELGGWTIDGLCVVEVVDAVCGDGQVTGDELCDDGNLDDGDGCDAQCVPEDEPPGTTGDAEGDGTTSDGGLDDTGTDDEPMGTAGPDDPTAGDGDGSSTGSAAQDDASASDGCGCTSREARTPASTWLWGLIVLGLRRRRAA